MSVRDGYTSSSNTTRRKTTSSVKQDLFPAKQRGFYSDILREEASSELEAVREGPPRNESKVWKTVKERHIPKVTTFRGPDDDEIESPSFGPTTAPVTKSDFPWSAWEPKVQIPYETEPGQVPRKIAIERYKRLFASQDLEALLEERNVFTSDLMPWRDFNMRVDLTQVAPNSERLYPPFLSLEIFDNTEYDCRQPHEWLNLGLRKKHQKPVPGKALLSTTGKDIADPDKFQWMDVGVMKYDKKTNLYLVRAVGVNGVQHNVISDTTKLNAFVDNEINKNQSKILPTTLTVQGCWVPRIRLMFCSEDPVVFAERVAEAYRLRRKTEALIRYNLYVDCMPVDEVAELETSSLENMINWASDTSRLKKRPSFGESLHILSNEVKLDFARAMNKISFDKVVASLPGKFWYVTLPDVEEELVPNTGEWYWIGPTYWTPESKPGFHIIVAAMAKNLSLCRYDKVHYEDHLRSLKMLPLKSQGRWQ